MEWLKRMLNAIEYMESHMEEPLDVGRTAQVACSSIFHFQRMFHMLTGVTLAEYVRKRKLTLAAQELVCTKAKVIDVALKYSYDTPESFSKAFRRVHGVSPSAVRKPGVPLKAYPKLSFHLSIKGDQDMDYRIVSKEGFQVVGKTLKVTTKDGENFKRIPKFWNECYQDGSCPKLCQSGKENLFGICLDMNHEQEEFTYMIAVEGGSHQFDAEFVTKEIPASNWAVFTCVGAIPAAIQQTWNRIYQEWFPATGYEHAGTAELEVYPPGDSGSDEYRCEVWIPILKKE
ncbi:AraC family transcriptional regulator [Sporomusa malonica]|uniref:AraC family transcriptional regulator n=1 Tax=Sporomusa malonica TaxID=112901 RepID=A0A1W2CWR9_9FIRM|nr:AraC family transcriptional regulator [Sporomusa malonica]SMC89693.1 AraC family transcriptional regulator [Sporomusa malonica]